MIEDIKPPPKPFNNAKPAQASSLSNNLSRPNDVVNTTSTTSQSSSLVQNETEEQSAPNQEKYEEVQQDSTNKATDSGEEIAGPVSNPSDATRKNVLCVEDEPFIGDLYKRALEKAGYSAEIIADGYQGLERAKSNEFDIILLDIMIPQLLGIDVLHELKKVPNLKAKLIIATNLEQDEETRAKIEQEADAYLIKAEITPTELVEFLKNFN